MADNLIMTVTGEIPGEKLGFCHGHEHIFIADGQSAKLNPALRIDDFDKTVEELLLFKKTGGMSIVDAQPVGCGRIAESLEMASKSTGINIIASTGFHKLIFYPKQHWIHDMGESELTDLYISELKSGMFIQCDNKTPSERISARAGIIKTAADVDGICGEYKKLFNAAANASKNTGVPIMSHTEAGTALQQIKYLTDLEVHPEALIICHIDRKADKMSYHLEVAATGVYMELDTIGRFKYHSDEDEVKLILKLIDKGYEDKIILGLDATRERLKSYGGNIGLDYISQSFIPMLKSYGVPNNIINKFMILNPMKAFSKIKNN